MNVFRRQLTLRLASFSVSNQTFGKAFRRNFAASAHANVNAPQRTEYCIAIKVM